MALEGKRILITAAPASSRRRSRASSSTRTRSSRSTTSTATRSRAPTLADHPNFTLHQGDVLDGEQLKELAARRDALRPLRRDRRRRDRAREPGAHDARQRDRHLQRARGRARDASTRSSASSTSRPARSSAPTPTTSARARSRRSARSARRAGRTPSRSSPASTWRTPTTTSWSCPTVTVHPFNVFGPGQIGGGAIRAFIEAALDGRDLTVRGDGSQIRAWCYVTDMVSGVLACLERPEAVGQAFNIGNPRSSVTIYDLAHADQAAHRLPGRDRLRAARLRRRRAPDPERREGARAARLGAEVELDDGLDEDDRVVPGEIAPIRLARPGHGRGGARRGRGGARERDAHAGPARRRVRGAELARGLRDEPRARGLVGHGGAPSRGARARARSPATRSSFPPTPSRRPRTSSRSPACGRCSSTSTR